MQAKKSLGQNFFVNNVLAQKIVDIATKDQPELIIEIGPGTGSFTILLEQRCKKLICIEKDENIAKNLSEIYRNIEVINQDILCCNISKIINQAGFAPSKTIIFGSLPYNISKPIIDQMLTTSEVKEQFYIIQKEVAQKYCAKVSDNNYLAVATQVLSTPKMIFDISPQSFRPIPKVNSTLINFSLNESPFNEISAYKKFQKFVHLCFTKPNKTIKNNIGKDLAEKVPETLLWTLEKRPFALEKEIFVELFNSLQKKADLI